MTGIDTFRSATQAEDCLKKAERIIKKVNQVIIPSIGITAVWLLLSKISSPNNIFLESIMLIMILVNLASLVYAESLFYMGKLFSLPFRKPGGILGIIAFLFYIVLYMMALLIAPACVLLYEKYLCKITIECANDYI